MKLRELIEKETVDYNCIETFVEKLSAKISEQHDVTKKTDGQIFAHNEQKESCLKYQKLIQIHFN